MYEKRVVEPSREILIVRHSTLNGSNGNNLYRIIEKTIGLEKYTNGKVVVPAIEGDVVQVQGTNEPVLTHKQRYQLSSEEYRKLRERGVATSLTEVLDDVAEYQQRNSQRIVFCIEPKLATKRETIHRTVEKLREYGISDDDAFFDSIFWWNLDGVHEANQIHGTNYRRSFHFSANIGRVMIPLPPVVPRSGYEIVSVPKHFSFGDPGKPLLYGSVVSEEALEKIAEDGLAFGVYTRFREGPGLRGFFKRTWNSVSNTERFRKISDS